MGGAGVGEGLNRVFIPTSSQLRRWKPARSRREERKPRVESAPLITNNVKTSDKIKRGVSFSLKVQNSTSESCFIQSFILSL